MTVQLQCTSVPTFLPSNQSVIHPEMSTIQAYTLGVVRQIPKGAWDSHIHVIDPKNFPLDQSARYSPSSFSAEQALAFEGSIGFQKVVLVQPSIYGNDNRCLLEALRVLGPRRARGVVTFDPESVDTEQLRDWHRAGVRGVRLNLQSVGRAMNDIEFVEKLQQYADIVRPFGWVLQMYIPMSMMPLLECIAPMLNITLCLDHFASPDLRISGSKGSRRPQSPYEIEGFTSLLRLLSTGRTFIKMSAAYRLAADYQDSCVLNSLAIELLRVAGHSRLVWASDWPHTRFEGHDVFPFLQTCLQWCGNDEHLKQRLFRDNAEDLWGRS